MKVLRPLAFPACCGIMILGYWGWSTTNINASGERDLSDLAADLKEFQSSFKSHIGLTLVAITDEQQPHVEHLLKEYNFTPLMRNVYHPGHGKLLNLYGWVHHETKSKDLKIGGEYGEVKKPSNKVAGVRKAVEPRAIASWLTPARTTTVTTRTTPSAAARRSAVRRTDYW